MNERWFLLKKSINFGLSVCSIHYKFFFYRLTHQQLTHSLSIRLDSFLTPKIKYKISRAFHLRIGIKNHARQKNNIKFRYLRPSLRSHSIFWPDFFFTTFFFLYFYLLLNVECQVVALCRHWILYEGEEESWTNQSKFYVLFKLIYRFSMQILIKYKIHMKYFVFI